MRGHALPILEILRDALGTPNLYGVAFAPLDRSDVNETAWENERAKTVSFIRLPGTNT